MRLPPPLPGIFLLLPLVLPMVVTTRPTTTHPWPTAPTLHEPVDSPDRLSVVPGQFGTGVRKCGLCGQTRAAASLNVLRSTYRQLHIEQSTKALARCSENARTFAA